MLSITQLLAEIDQDENLPLYQQLAGQLRQLIESGELAPGARLPASRVLARVLKMSRLSIVHAYGELRAEGLLEAQPGKGTFVVNRDGPFPNQNTVTQQQQSRKEYKHPELPPHQTLYKMMRMGSQQEGVICFTTGSAPHEFFPLKPLRQALDTVLDRDGAHSLGYEPTAGYPPLRQAVREYVLGQGIRCQLDEVLITGGAQQGIDLVLQALTSTGDTILATNPTYLGLLDSVHARRLRVHGIPLDEEGPSLAALEQALLERDGMRPALIFAMPSFHNPTGLEMSLPRRRQLLSLAMKYHLPILEDGASYEFRYEGENLPPLKALDEQGIVIHTSTFSKNLLPGMRVGYIIAEQSNRERLESIKYAAEVATSGLSQRVIHLLLERGVIAQQLGVHLREMQRRRDVALAAAAEFFPNSWHWQVPAGGFFLWITLPPYGPTAAELFVQALRYGVSFAIGDVFHSDGGGYHNLRLNFISEDVTRIPEGFQRLARAWRDLPEDGRPRSRRPLL